MRCCVLFPHYHPLVPTSNRLICSTVGSDSMISLTTDRSQSVRTTGSAWSRGLAVAGASVTSAVVSRSNNSASANARPEERIEPPSASCPLCLPAGELLQRTLSSARDGTNREYDPSNVFITPFQTAICEHTTRLDRPTINVGMRMRPTSYQSNLLPIVGVVWSNWIGVERIDVDEQVVRYWSVSRRYFPDWEYDRSLFVASQ